MSNETMVGRRRQLRKTVRALAKIPANPLDPLIKKLEAAAQKKSRRK